MKKNLLFCSILLSSKKVFSVFDNELDRLQKHKHRRPKNKSRPFNNVPRQRRAVNPISLLVIKNKLKEKVKKSKLKKNAKNQPKKEEPSGQGIKDGILKIGDNANQINIVKNNKKRKFRGNRRVVQAPQWRDLRKKRRKTQKKGTNNNVERLE